MQKSRVQQQDVRLERIGTGRFRDDLAQQTADRFQQHEAIAIARCRAVLLQGFRNRGKTPRRDVPEGQSERGRPHCLGKKSSNARTN